MMKKAVICHLIHGLRIGGAEMLVARLARCLRRDFSFRFICLDELGSLGEELRSEGFPVEVMDRRPGIDWRLPFRLARLLARNRVDLIHAHQYSPFFYALTARLLYWHPPILFTEHGRWIPDYPRRKRIIANRLLLQRRDRVVGVGEYIRQALIINEGILARRVEVLFNGVDLTPYRQPAPDRMATRRDIGLQEDDFVIILVARLVPIKNHLTAVRALHLVALREPNARLILVGEGPEERAIRAGIEEYGLEQRVRLLGLRTDVPRLLQAADVFLLTSINEGIPLTVIEAMAAGLPVVSTAVGGVAEVVLDGQTGLLAPAGNAEILSQHLLRLSADADLRTQLGQVGRARAFAHFSEDEMLAAYERLYREMLR
jgi:glycosyltransferase involved in cell wall biosynthesis